ncbi:lysoplasmalogenase [Rhodococcus sp. TAF43]|uniref:lysoplasmalogenase n=1 Tax=Rhodococcus sp. TAF43 TaxID=3237483 RepID=UPI003F9B92CC
MIPRQRAVRFVWVVFGLLAIVHLSAQLVDRERVADVTQWFLMPVLAGALWLGTGGSAAPRRSRLVVLTLVALGFSWLGDTAPDLADGDLSFLLMVGFFLLAQVAYIAAFAPYGRAEVWGRRRWSTVGYLVAVGFLVLACAPGAGPLLVPALLYGSALGAMAILAAGVNRLVAVGGALFLVSDGMIALGAFADWFSPPVEGFWVMLTYIAAQVLIVLGVQAADRDHQRGSSAPHVLAGNG